MLRPIIFAVLVGLLGAGLTGCQTGKGQLKAGDCINFESSGDAEGGSEQVTVVVDCAEPHLEEVFKVFELPGATFPGYFEIGDAQQDECGSAFKDYVGIEWEKSSYTIDYQGPTEQTWPQGDHTIVCLLADSAGANLTGSVKDSGR